MSNITNKIRGKNSNDELFLPLRWSKMTFQGVMGAATVLMAV